MSKLFRKIKNKGFTLVEVLVAAAILSLVVPPILSSFVTIARVNSKSRQKLSATTIANGVMEAVKGFDLLEVSKQSNFPGTGNSDFHIIPSFTGTTAEVDVDRNVEANKSVAKTGAGYEFKPHMDGFYSFLYKNVALDGTHYDVLVTYTLVVNDKWDEVKVSDGKGHDVLYDPSGILEPLSIRILHYYNIDIKVVRSGQSFDQAVLAHIEGTKADYN